MSSPVLNADPEASPPPTNLANALELMAEPVNTEGRRHNAPGSPGRPPGAPRRAAPMAARAIPADAHADGRCTQRRGCIVARSRPPVDPGAQRTMSPLRGSRLATSPAASCPSWNSADAAAATCTWRILNGPAYQAALSHAALSRTRRHADRYGPVPDDQKRHQRRRRLALGSQTSAAPTVASKLRCAWAMRMARSSPRLRETLSAVARTSRAAMASADRVKVRESRRRFLLGMAARRPGAVYVCF